MNKIRRTLLAFVLVTFSSLAFALNPLQKINLEEIPPYDGSPFVVINDNFPFFEEDEMTTEPFEIYSELDSLGRCGIAYAKICRKLMSDSPRESISSVIPSGWHNQRYSGVPGGWVYNRCHLIGFQLAGENANPLNLITGTRYMNMQGMLPFENIVGDFVRQTNCHVIYRVTPIFNGDNLVASGVLMEACSVEDEGEAVTFCVYCYNVQPGIFIDYKTGLTSKAGGKVADKGEAVVDGGDASVAVKSAGDGATVVAKNGVLLNKAAPSSTESRIPPKLPAGTKVYWTPGGKSYHLDKNCRALAKSKKVEEGPIETCPKTDPCDFCCK